MKIALLGAGSREFAPATLRDLMLSDVLRQDDLEIVLMDIDPEPLGEQIAYAEDVARRLHRTATFRATTDLREAVAAAQFVVSAIEVCRYQYWCQDFHVPRKYGFRQIYGENGGPGGLFHALRNMGPTLEIARAMEEQSPDAWLINYTNPESKLCEAVTRLTSVRTVGLCHGVFEGRHQLARLLERPVEDLATAACGINHFTWFQSLQDRATGRDLYPELRDRERRAHWLAEWDEIALSRVLFRTFGLWPSPGTNHIGEYIRWAADFLGSAALQFFYDPAEGKPWEQGKTPTWIYNLHGHPTDVPLYPSESVERVVPAHEDHQAQQDAITPSGELAIPIIESLAYGVEHALAAVNVPNRGAIPGLPEESVVEVPATADISGLHSQTMEPLPEAVMCLIRTQLSIHQLLVEAYQERSRDKLLQALLLDPTVDSYANAVNVIDEMFDLQADVLPTMSWQTRSVPRASSIPSP